MKNLPGMGLRLLAFRLIVALALAAAGPARAGGRGSASLGVSCRVVRSARVTVVALASPIAAAAAVYSARLNGRQPVAATSAERVEPDGARYTVVTVMVDAPLR